MPTVSSLLTVGVTASLILSSLLPLSSLQAIVAEQGRGDEKWDHGGSDGGALPQIAAWNGPLKGERRHEMCSIQRPATRDGVDQLEVGESVEHGKCHHDCHDRHQHRQRDEAET